MYGWICVTRVITKADFLKMIFTPSVSGGCNSFDIVCVCVCVCLSVRLSVSLPWLNGLT